MLKGGSNLSAGAAPRRAGTARAPADKVTSAEAARKNAVLAATAADEARRFEERAAAAFSPAVARRILGGVPSIGVQKLKTSSKG